MNKNNADKLDIAMSNIITRHAKTIQPSKDFLVSVLSQIPDKKYTEKEKLSVLSPYAWTTLIQISSICFIFILAYPSIREYYTYKDDPFYLIDKQVEIFEKGVNNDDYNNILLNYNNL